MSNIFGTNTTSDLMSVAETAQKIMQGKSLTEDWLEAEMRKVQHKWPRTNPKIKKQWLDKQKARAEKDGMDMSAGGEFEDRLDDYELTIHADDKVWTEASKIKSKWKKMSTAQRTKWLDKIDDLARKQNTSDEDVRAIRDEFGLHMSEEVEVAEAVLIDRDYEYDGKVIKISKKNFSKVHRDFKGTTKGKETMLTYDDKEGTVLVPVQFTEEVAEAKGTAYPATIDTLKMIVKDKQNQIVMFKSGQARVDSFTASAMVAVYDAMKPATKKKFEEMIKDKGGFMKTQAFAMKMTEDVRWNDQIKEDPSLLESLLNEDPDMEEIVKELEGASKMHLAQSKRIQKHLDKMKSEEVEVTESTHGKKGTFTMAPFEDLRGVADVALKIMQGQPQEVKEEEQEVTSEETPQKLTE